MFFNKKSEAEKEIKNYEKVFKSERGATFKGPVGMSLNLVYSGFRQQYDGVNSFVSKSQKEQDAYLEKLMHMHEAAEAKEQHPTMIAVHIFTLYLISAQEGDKAAHAKAKALMTELSKAGDLISG
ncbi:hypothetical protein [Kushneria avicenniae]|uniref:hypothetical protein n=1 Tax=Kushneria avicenniae TaxID=402385 RepID=UPI0011145237|nr:hypothetical protein [Kushneria avicenniae]